MEFKTKEDITKFVQENLTKEAAFFYRTYGLPLEYYEDIASKYTTLQHFMRFYAKIH